KLWPSCFRCSIILSVLPNSALSLWRGLGEGLAETSPRTLFLFTGSPLSELERKSNLIFCLRCQASPQPSHKGSAELFGKAKAHTISERKILRQMLLFA